MYVNQGIWYILHSHPVKAQASLRISMSPQSLLCLHQNGCLYDFMANLDERMCLKRVKPKGVWLPAYQYKVDIQPSLRDHSAQLVGSTYMKIRFFHQVERKQIPEEKHLTTAHAELGLSHL